MKQLDELIAMIEAATEGSESLDDAIALYVLNPAKELLGGHVSPFYTTSIDDATKLIPDAFHLENLGQMPCLSVDRKPLWSASVNRLMKSVYDRATDRRKVSHSGYRPTAALAICEAALKARKAAPDLAKLRWVAGKVGTMLTSEPV